LTSDAAGNSYVHLSSEPWIIRYTPTGEAQPLSIRSDLSFARDVVVQADGSLLVAGAMTTSDARSTVLLERLSATGELLASVTLPAAAAPAQAGFSGLARAPGGSVYIAAVETLAGDYFDAEFHVYAVAQSGSVGAVPIVNTSNIAFLPVYLAADDSGAFTYSGSYNDVVEVQIAQQYYELVDSFTTGHLGSMISDGRGGWFISTGAGWTNAVSNLGYYHHTLYRFDKSGQELWRIGDGFDPLIWVGDTIFHQTSIALLADSVVITAPYGAFGADAGPEARIARYTLDGTLVRTFFLPGNSRGEGPGYAAAIGPQAAAFLVTDTDTYTLMRLDFDALVIAPSPAGSPCSENAACSSGVCCPPVGAGLGVCSSGSTCDAGTRCESDAICGALACYKPTSGTSGACVPRCQTTNDCAGSTFCVASVCLDSCAGAGSTCAVSDMSCAAKTNMESVSVWVCAYP
jgi:hypothetical protein